MSDAEPSLVRGVEKLVRAGERAGMSVEDMVFILQAGVSVETLLDLITRNLPLAEQQRVSTLEQNQFLN